MELWGGNLVWNFAVNSSPRWNCALYFWVEYFALNSVVEFWGGIKGKPGVFPWKIENLQISSDSGGMKMELRWN